MIESIANLATAVFGALAAFYWWRVAIEHIPSTKYLTVDMTNFNWLTKPLARQARNNKLAAIFAALTAAGQVAIAVIKVV